MAIILSKYTDALLVAVKAAKEKRPSTDTTHITVSQTVSFFALLYEKIRNSIEFREEHLVRRAAIERILRRRLAINPTGNGEGENLVRELLWARYMSTDTLKNSDISNVQEGITKFFYVSKLVGKTHQKLSNLQSQYLHDVLSCEIEEQIEPEKTKKLTAHLYFFYHVLRQKFHIDGVEEGKRDAYFYAAAEEAFARNDTAYTRYHLFTLNYGPFTDLDQGQLEKLAESWPTIVTGFNNIINNPYKDKLVKQAKKHVAPFLILNDIVEKKEGEIEETLTDEEKLLTTVQETCDAKYKDTGIKLRTAIIRSISYIFLTKMIFVLLLEIPLTRFFYGKLDVIPLVMNVFMPPLFMGLSIAFSRVPGAKNTQKIYNRIVNIINDDTTFETSPIRIGQKKKTSRPLLVLGFTLAYFVFFGLLFSIIFLLLDKIGFNIIEKVIFVFFLTVVGFFGYRIRQTAKEYSLEDTEGVLSPLVYFMFLPILSVGKFLSSEVARLNFLMLIFDFLIEAPFKMIIEIIEEWVKFVRARRDEI